MTNNEKNRKREQEFTESHTLTKEQLKQLIFNKLERGKQYSLANRKREGLTGAC